MTAPTWEAVARLTVACPEPPAMPLRSSTPHWLECACGGTGQRPWLPGLSTPCPKVYGWECQGCGRWYRGEAPPAECSHCPATAFDVLECDHCHGAGWQPIAPSLDALMRAAAEAGYVLTVTAFPSGTFDAQVDDDVRRQTVEIQRIESPLAAALAALLALREAQG